MTITTLKGILNRKFAGSNIDEVQGISDYSLFAEAAGYFLGEVNAAETTRLGTLEVFQDVYDYAPQADFKELVDTRPQNSARARSDNATRRFSEEFDQNKNWHNDEFAVEWRDAAKVLRYSKSISGSTGIHNMDSLAGNGTWTGTAANIALSTQNPYKGGGSIVADYDTGEYIENTGLTAVDLSDHENKSTLFLAGYFPDASLVTSIELRFGSSSANYFSRSRTAPQFGAFRNGWNLIPFAWNGATETGTVDTDNIDYLRITPTLSSSDTDIKFDNIFSALGVTRDILYYSNYLFRSAAGTWLATPTADSDILNLDTDSENLYVYECIRLIAAQLQNRDTVYTKYTNELYGTPQKVGMYERYKRRKPDEMIVPQGRYRRFGYNKK